MKRADLYRPRRERDERNGRQQARRALLQAERDGRTAVVVSHGHCLDGVGSVVVALRALGPADVGIFYTQPSDIQDALEQLAEHDGRGRRLLIADLSLNPGHYDRIVAACRALRDAGWRIEWLDHHHKQWEDLDLEPLRQAVELLEVNDDATESGASLVQKAVAPKDRFAKRFANTVKDRDLWWNKTPDSETLEFAITWLGTDDFTAHFVSKGPKEPVVDDFIQDAADKQRTFIEERTDALLREVIYFPAANGDQVGVVYGWLPKNVGLHRLLQKDRVKVAINVRPNGKMSLRSRKDAPVTHLVARRFDGGGHPNASGADLGLKGLAYWWYVLRHGRVARTYAVAEAAVEEIEQLAAAR